MITITASVAAALGVAIVVRMAWATRPRRFARPRGLSEHHGGSNDAGARRTTAGTPTHRVDPRSMAPGAKRRSSSGLQLSLEVVTDAPGCHRRAARSRDEGIHPRAAGHAASGAGAGQRLC